MNIFNNDNPITNGELSFYNHIKNNINVIFDVGCRCDTLFNSFKGDVHYFEPCKEFLDKIKNTPNENSNSYYNNFGLGNDNKKLFYYPKYQSFINRINSLGGDDKIIELEIKKGSDYFYTEQIDFLKIDTEGFEFEVIKGFGEILKNIKIIQFEYGGTFKDNNTTLKEIITYLSNMGFVNFSYLINNGMVPIKNTSDHYQYCNIICFNV